MEKIIRNAIRCKLCGDIIESVHHHDFKQCKCGACCVDGGHLYLRRGWDPSFGSKEDVFEDLSEVEVRMVLNTGGTK